MSKRKPYTFPHRSRKAMTEYLMDRTSYSDHYTVFPFSWNVKAYHVDWTRPKGEYELTASLDDEWESYADEHALSIERWAFEDAARQINDNEWCSYPGDDQGDWEFGFAGRQAGHLCLMKWRGHKVYGHMGFDLSEFLESLTTDELRAFYKGIRTADSDFTPRKASEEVEYHVNFIRWQWEQERNEELEEEAREVEESRPDLYGER